MIIYFLTFLLIVGCSSDEEAVAPVTDNQIPTVDNQQNTVRNYYTGILLGHTDDVLSVAFSPDGSTIASGSKDETIRLWNTRDGKHIHSLEGHTDDVTGIAFSP